ncbi:MAG TPA: hypothetical protein VF595_04410 [Tepidisphaeraceae bacterium]
MRQIERWWQIQAFDRLIDELCIGRAEAVGGIRQLLSGAVAGAALAVIRLDELNQSHLPISSKMVRYLLASQAPDGGWGDPVTTALALRALSRGAGAGLSVERAIERLGDLQRDDGQWPREPFRRAPSDPAVTAFVLFQLAETRTVAAAGLIDRTLDRVADDLSDRQLAPLRRRVATARQFPTAA